MSKGTKKQKRIMKKQKKNFIRLIKDGYNVYDAYFLVMIVSQYIKDLHKYHTDKLNVWCAEEDHKKIMESLNYAYELVIRLEKIEEESTLYADGTGLTIIAELFKVIGENVDKWWD